MPRVAPNENYSLPSKLISLELQSIANTVLATARRVVTDEGSRAHKYAVEHAPVRKVFTGGRNRKRLLSRRELKAAEAAAGGPVSSYQVTRRNPNTMIRTAEDIMARKVQPMSYFRVGSHGQAIPRDTSSWGRQPGRPLNAEGRYALAHSRMQETERGDLVDVGRGGITAYTVRDAKTGEIQGYRYMLGGALRRSVVLSYVEDGDSTQAVVSAGGETAPYARFMEFGTRYVAARPFLRPALKQVEVAYRSRMYSALRRSLEG